MITEDEKKFIEYWESNRLKEKNYMRFILRGLPLGLIFALPVLVAVIFHNWYKSMTYISDAQVVVVMIAVMAIAVFFAVFRMKFKWENNEQLYKELKLRETDNDAADK